MAGLAHVGVRYKPHSQDPAQWPLIDNAKIEFKLLIILIILALGYMNKKKEKVSSTVRAIIGELTIGNIIIAVVW